MTYAEILAELRTFEATEFRNDMDLRDQLALATHDALVALLEKLVADAALKESP